MNSGNLTGGHHLSRATLTSLETGSKVEIRDTIASVHPWMLKGRKGVTMEEKLDAMLVSVGQDPPSDP